MRLPPRVDRCRVLVVAGLCALFVWVGVAPACADAPSSAGDISVAQTLGERELTVVLRRVTSVPGPLQVEIVTHAGSPEGRLALTVTPTGATTTGADAASVGVPADRSELELAGAPGAYTTALHMNRVGPWELSIDDGVRVARIPFVVPAQVSTPPERLVYGGFLVAGLSLPIAAVVALRARRTGWALIPAAGVVAGVAVAVTAALLSASLPLPPQPGEQLDPSVGNVSDPYALNKPLTSDFSRPPVILTVASAPLTAGSPGELDLVLTDSATGGLVDDLLVHDSALMHLLTVSPSGRLSHLHPIRTGPGRYQVRIASPEAGRNALSVELVRRGGGVQMVRAATGFLVQGGAPTAAATPVGLGADRMVTAAQVGGEPVTLRTTTAPIAGAPVTLTAGFGDANDLQPWLGMVGHMITAGPVPEGASDIAAAVHDSPIWGHAHSMGPAAMPGMPGHGAHEHGGTDADAQDGHGTDPGTKDHDEHGPRRGTDDQPGMDHGSGVHDHDDGDGRGGAGSADDGNSHHGVHSRTDVTDQPGRGRVSDAVDGYAGAGRDGGMNAEGRGDSGVPGPPGTDHGMHDHQGSATESGAGKEHGGDTAASGRGEMLMPPVNGDSAPDETVAAYGPDVSFTYTFPTEGQYRLWIQVERNYRILTVPLVLEVGAAPGGQR
ncbi:GumC domain-containing protein [Nocardia callitridis]|uniref:hypothetical protein n=1 Tax=Nocardia callitridis TaxID=648753 RepID=UPI0031EA7CE5